MTVAAASTIIDWDRIRGDFPLLRREVHGKPLIYLDSANTGQKPECVIAATDDFYRNQKIGELAYHQAAGKPIFALDYAPWWDAPRVDAAARSLGYLPYVTVYGRENPLPS